MKRSYRARGIALGAVCLTAVLAGCSASAPEPEASPSGKVLATLSVFGPSSYDTFASGAPEDVVADVTSRLDEAFRTAEPEVTEILHDSRGSTADGLSRLRNAILANTQIDVIMCSANPVNQSYVSTNLLMPLDDIVPNVEDYLTPGALNSFTVGGHVYGIPVSSVDTRTFFYNKDLFADLGVDAPTTYDELVAVGEELTDAGVQPIVAQGRNTRSWAAYYMSILAQTSGGAQLEKTESNLAGDTKFTDAADVEAFSLLHGLIEDGLLSLGGIDYDAEGMRSAFISGKAGMYFAGSSDLAILQANVSDFEIGTFTFPHFENQPGDAVAFGGTSNGLCISSRAQNVQGAKDYITFAASPEMAALTLEPVVTFASSHTNVPGGDSEIIKALRDQATTNQKYLDWVWPADITSTINDQIQQMMVGTVTPEQAAKSVQAKMDELLVSGYTYVGSKG